MAGRQQSSLYGSPNVRWNEKTLPKTTKQKASSIPAKSAIVQPTARHLFTVKPGGIAGYLGSSPLPGLENPLLIHVVYCVASLTGTDSYVDIKAKVDTYVGFLPHHAMERLIERRPIVLLTLSKRLISLLSPLGANKHRRLMKYMLTLNHCRSSSY